MGGLRAAHFFARRRNCVLSGFQFRLPHSFEVTEVLFHLDSGYGVGQICSCAPQSRMVVLGFGAGIAVEAARQPTTSATIRMEHQDYMPGSVQAHGLADLFQNELAVSFVFRRCQAFGAASNLDWVRVDHGESK